MLLGLAMMAITWSYALRGLYVSAPRPRADLAELGASLRGALLPMLMPLVILGGILLGVVTATEAGVLAATLGLAGC